MDSPASQRVYIAFLRAVNVGGRMVKMERLRAALTELGLRRVRTYIQSGNVFFDSGETDRGLLTDQIEKCLQETFKMEIPVVLRTIPEVEKAVRSSPFVGIEPATDARFLIMFLRGSVPNSLQVPYVPAKADFEIVGKSEREVYAIMYVRDGRIGNPALYVEKTTKNVLTTRFVHTTQKIIEAAAS